MEKLLPDTQRLVELRERGLSYRKIAEWIRENEGIVVSPGAVGAALSRAGKTSGRARYENHVPWLVHAEHSKHYAVRMLRLLGRRDSGLPLNEDQNQRLDAWLEKLREEHALVAYLPEEFPEEGFVYVDGDWPKDGIPIRRPKTIGGQRKG